MTLHVLLIENHNLDQSESLLSSLQNQGYQVSIVHTPKTAAKRTETLWPNLIIFNPMSSQLKLSSFQQAISKINLNIPYVVVGDRYHLPGEAKADIVLVAPDKLQQLAHGIKKATSHQEGRFIRLPDLVVDCQQRQVLHNKKRYPLTPKEFKLLHLLIDNHDQVLSRKTIMQKVWETDYMGDTRTLDVHVRWLREKIEENPSRPRRLITIRGVGYHFVMQPE